MFDPAFALTSVTIACALVIVSSSLVISLGCVKSLSLGLESTSKLPDSLSP